MLAALSTEIGVREGSMARAIWSGAVSFGLVSEPVKA